VTALLTHNGSLSQQDQHAAQNYLASVQAEHRALERRWGEEREQLLLVNTRLSQKDSQYKAELRKKEKVRTPSSLAR
jgi:hypothetical protein